MNKSEDVEYIFALKLVAILNDQPQRIKILPLLFVDQKLDGASLTRIKVDFAVIDGLEHPVVGFNLSLVPDIPVEFQSVELSLDDVLVEGLLFLFGRSRRLNMLSRRVRWLKCNFESLKVRSTLEFFVRLFPLGRTFGWAL